MSKFHDLKANRSMPLSEAVELGLLIVTDDILSPAPSSVVKETKSIAIKSVIDSRTGEEIPIADAVRHQIVDKNRKQYIDLKTNEVFSLAEAIDKGLVITETVTEAAQVSAVVKIGKTNLFCITSVKDAETGKW